VRITARHPAKTLVTAAAAAASLILAGTSAAAAASAGRPDGPAWTGQVRQILSGRALRHTFVPAGSARPRSERLADPDDITGLGGDLFTAFQNGVGPQGQASSDGNTASTVVEFTPAGRVIRQWDITGKCDGLTADAGRRLVIATVNEDAHSSVFTITPGDRPGPQVWHYRYNRPLPHHGGTDAISVAHGQVLISASAPGTTGRAAPQAAYPAVYSVTFNRAAHVATVSALFSDEAAATVANVGAAPGATVALALTDPDSNEIVPPLAPRFAGDFMLTSQGDKEQIFARPGARPGGALAVLRLSQSVDDTAWARSSSGRLFGADTSGDTIDAVTGPFRPGAIFVAVTPCDAGNAPATCPAPGFPANYLGALSPWTGVITRVALHGPAFEPQGLVFVSGG
jgi:hypothetical protein